jgi:Fructose-1,6-bisphosphatase
MNDLDEIVQTVAETSNYIETNLASHAGMEAGTNPSGDEQIQADIWADELFFDELSILNGVGGYASEERESVVNTGEGYTVSIDPLDGSSNLRSNNPVGTIIGIYDAELPARGWEQVGAIMVLYGPYTTMTVAREDTDAVQKFVLQDGYRERLGSVTHPTQETVAGIARKRGERTQGFDTLAATRIRAQTTVWWCDNCRPLTGA